MTRATSAPSRLRHGLRLLLMATSASLALGLVLSLLTTGPAALVASAMVWLGLGMLVVVPALNVVAVLIDEWHTADRRFAAAAMAVLLLLAYTTIAKLGLVGELLSVL